MKPSSFVICALILVALFLLRRRLTRTKAALGLLLAVWFGVRGTGVIDLPDLEEIAKDVGPTLGAWTYPIVGLMAFLETAFFLGLVAPGEFTVTLGGFIAGQGEVEVVSLAVLVWACAFAGDVTSYLLGRRLGRGFLLEHGPRFKISHERLSQTEAFLQRHGGKTILVGRFLGLFRALAPFIFGASRVPARRFIPIDFLAAGIWAVTFVTLGYVFWRSFDRVVDFAKKGTFALGALVTLVAGGILLYRWLHVPENRKRLRQAWRERRLKPLTEPNRR